MGDLTLFEALTGGAFNRLNWQQSGQFDQNFSKTSNARGFARGGGGAVGGFGIDRYINKVTDWLIDCLIVNQLHCNRRPSVQVFPFLMSNWFWLSAKKCFLTSKDHIARFQALMCTKRTAEKNVRFCALGFVCSLTLTSVKPLADNYIAKRYKALSVQIIFQLMLCVTSSLLSCSVY